MIDSEINYRKTKAQASLLICADLLESLLHTYFTLSMAADKDSSHTLDL